MSTLGWLIYFTNIADVITTLAVLITIGSLSVAGFATLIAFIEGIQKPRFVKNFCIIAGISLLIAIVIPDRNTMFLIIASEMGTQVVTSDQAKNSIVLFNAWMKAETDHLRK